MEFYKDKYLKYKQKYSDLKQLNGGLLVPQLRGELRLFFLTEDTYNKLNDVSTKLRDEEAKIKAKLQQKKREFKKC